MTRMPPHMTLEEAAAFAEREPGVYVLEIGHDDGCPALRTQKEDDCACWCKPRYRLFRGTPAVVLPDWPQPKVKRGCR